MILEGKCGDFRDTIWRFLGRKGGALKEKRRLITHFSFQSVVSEVFMWLVMCTLLKGFTYLGISNRIKFSAR